MEEKYVTAKNVISEITKKEPTQEIWGHYFRGVKNSSYTLLPSLANLKGYKELSDNKKKDIEASILNQFQMESNSYDWRISNGIWNTMIWGQHYGLPTRLLDWTKNPLVALYFATEPKQNYAGCNSYEKNEDCAIYVYKQKKGYQSNQVCEDPLNCTIVGVVETNIIDGRMQNQQGCFSIQPIPHIPFDEQLKSNLVQDYEIKKFLINHKEREKIRKLVLSFAIREDFIYPELASLGLRLKRQYADGCQIISK